jgi:hypothetical protein
LELRSQPERQLLVTDPDGRMLTVSCGAALHHARVALVALGVAATVHRLPIAAEPQLLAVIEPGGAVPVSAAAMRRYQSIAMRHTDRRPVTTTPVEPSALAAISEAVGGEGARLHVLDRDQVIELAAEAAYAQHTQVADEAWRSELAYWAGGTRPQGTGVPDANIPAAPAQTTVPERDFGHVGTLTITADHDTAATYAILYGDEDAPAGWLRGGEALSAGWLAATEHAVSVLPLSAVVEIPLTRVRLSGMLTEGWYPYLVLRFGSADPDHRGPRPTPRLPVNQSVEVLAS